MAASIQLLTAVSTILLLSLATGEVVRCFRCHFAQLSEDNSPLMKNIAKGRTLGQVECKTGAPGHEYALDIVECPTIAIPDLKYKCGTVQGQIVEPALTVKIDVTVQGCVWGHINASLDQDCPENAPFSGTIKELIEEGMMVKDIKLEPEVEMILGRDNIVQFNSHTCFKTIPEALQEHNSSLQCVTCTHNMRTSETPIEEVDSAFSKVSTDACLLQKSGDKYKVSHRLCPKPDKGQQAMCGVISGVVSGQSHGKTFEYQSMKRGCVTRASSKPRSGCTNVLPPDGTTKNLLQKGLKFGGIQLVKVCYSNKGSEMVSSAHAVLTQRLLSVLVFGISALVSVALRVAI